MNNKQIKFGIILQYLQMGLGIVIQLIYTPFMLKILGDSEYGIYSLVSSIIAYLNLLSLGFGASYIRFYSRYKKENDESSIAKLNGLYLFVFFIMGIIAFGSGLSLAFNVNIFFNDTYTNNDLVIAKILMLFLAFNILESFVGSVFISYITAQEKFIFQKLINIGKTVLSPILSIIILLNGYGSIGMVIVTTVVTLLIDLTNVLFCILKLKMRISFKNMDFPLLKEIAAFSIFIAINQIIDQINWQTDKIILGKMVNATAVAIYSVGATINTLYVNFSTAISNVFAPRIHRIENSSMSDEEKNQEHTNLFIKVGRIQFAVVVLILLGFIFFGKWFVIKWAGDNYVDAYYVTLLLICPVTISLCQNLAIEIRRAKNKHQVATILMLVTSIINVIISIPLIRYWSYLGAALGTTISLIINAFLMNVYSYKILKIDVFKFWKSILTLFIYLIFPIGLGILFNLFWPIETFIDFICQILIFTFVYSVSYLILGMNKNEKIMLLKLIRRNKE